MNFHLRFIGDTSFWLVLSFALAAAIAVGWLYRRDVRNVQQPFRFLLPALRSAAVAIALLTLAGPVIHHRRTVGTLGRVMFAVDSSRSMSLSDPGEGDVADPGKSRASRAADLLTGNGQNVGWLELLKKTHLVEVAEFDGQDPSTIWNSRDGQPPTVLDVTADGDSTALSVALDHALQKLVGAGAAGTDLASEAPTRSVRAAVVVLTDGQDNSGEPAPDLARRLRGAGLTVHAIGFGSDVEPMRVAVADVRYPENISIDGVLAGVISVRHTGAVGSRATVHLNSIDNSIWSKEISIQRDGVTEVPFSVPVDPLVKQRAERTARGVDLNQVVLDLNASVHLDSTTPPTSVNSATQIAVNQSAAFPFRVSATTRKNRLLIVDGASRWETRYLRNTFSRDPTWEVNTVLFGPGTDSEQIRRGTGPGEFPATSADFAQYDAIVIGEIPVEQLRQDDQVSIASFVAGGGGLIFVDGRYDRMQRFVDYLVDTNGRGNDVDGEQVESQASSGSLADLLPVVFSSPDGGSRNTARVPVAGLRLTPQGVTQSALKIDATGDTDSDLELQKWWSKLPRPKDANRVWPKTGARVWAELILPDKTHVPWMVHQSYGAGQVLYLSSDHTWRWRYKVADRFHSRFWHQVAGTVARRPYAVSDRYLSIATDKIEYFEGAQATIRARLSGVDGAPVSDATVDALVLSGGQVIATVPMKVDNSALGTYTALTDPLSVASTVSASAGADGLSTDASVSPANQSDAAYEVKIRASGFDSNALLASAPIWVSKMPDREEERVSVNTDSLVAMAEAGGGQYVHENDAEMLLDEIEPLSSGTIIESDYHLWHSYPWFALLLVLLTSEWILRKRAGLV